MNVRESKPLGENLWECEGILRAALDMISGKLVDMEKSCTVQLSLRAFADLNEKRSAGGAPPLRNDGGRRPSLTDITRITRRLLLRQARIATTSRSEIE